MLAELTKTSNCQFHPAIPPKCPCLRTPTTPSMVDVYPRINLFHPRQLRPQTTTTMRSPVFPMDVRSLNVETVPLFCPRKTVPVSVLFLPRHPQPSLGVLSPPLPVPPFPSSRPTHRGEIIELKAQTQPPAETGAETHSL